jgi:hypothetical protein
MGQNSQSSITLNNLDPGSGKVKIELRRIKDNFVFSVDTDPDFKCGGVDATMSITDLNRLNEELCKAINTLDICGEKSVRFATEPDNSGESAIYSIKVKPGGKGLYMAGFVKKDDFEIILNREDAKLLTDLLSKVRNKEF